MTKDEALKMALNVLELYEEKLNSSIAIEVIQICKEALEQPTQPDIALYTHPKEWQGLSDYEIFKIEGLDCVDEEYIKRYARAIEAKLREKNK
jgi:hypothetical protein